MEYSQCHLFRQDILHHLRLKLIIVGKYTLDEYMYSLKARTVLILESTTDNNGTSFNECSCSLGQTPNQISPCEII